MSDDSSCVVPEVRDFTDRLVRNAPDAIIFADHRGVIRFWNGGAERTFGFTAAEAVGRSLDIIIPESLSLTESQIPLIREIAKWVKRRGSRRE
jgi:PAS domain S-box-containing protein